MTIRETPSSAAPSAVERIDRAITRIEAAVAARDQASDALTRRHEALRTRMSEAIAALDSVVGREEPR